MKTEPASENVIALPKPPARQRKLRFKIVPFANPSREQVWRVAGVKRDGTRIRENYPDEKAAQCRQAELLAEYHSRADSDTNLRATKLSDVQLRIAETAFLRVDADEEVLLAIEHWLRDGKKKANAKEAPRLDEAVTDFEKWLDATTSLRPRSKDFLRTQVNIFRNSVPNLRVSDFVPDHIDDFLDKRNVSTQTKINSRLAVSRFFSWCMKGRDRRWVTVNPCKAVEIEKEKREALPSVLSVDECAKLLRAAEKKHRGRMAPYIAVCLFGGLRPAEATRLTWDEVNLQDGEIIIKSQASKTNKPRVVMICDTLKAWLTAYKDKPFSATNRRRDLDALKQAAGYVGRESVDGGGAGDGKEKLKPWPSDVMRHSAISHYFRKTGSYGRTAEQFGNSEAIIKKHYQGRVSSEDTKAFYAIMPKKGGRK
jgi:integrase